MKSNRGDKQTGPKGRREVIEEIVERLAGRHSTAVVLFHQAVAERLGLGPTDHKCLHLLREHDGIAAGDPVTASKLAAITGLTTGAMTGVVARLETAGFLRREPDPQDQRRQLLYADMERAREIHNALAPIRNDVAAMLKGFDNHQLAAIAQFLKHSTDLAYRHAAVMRAQGSLVLDGSDGRQTTERRSPR